jgi:phage tail-like protein
MTGPERIAPAVASSRAELRRGLPGIYGDPSTGMHPDDAFVMRFLFALEEVLDPIVALLDALPAQFDVDIAAPHVLALVGNWLGLELGDYWLRLDRIDDRIEARLRRLVTDAPQLMQARGTPAAMATVLRDMFDDLPLTVEDSGRCTHSAEGTELPDADPPAFKVTCATPLAADEAARLRRVVAEVRPVHVSGTLSIGGVEEAVA